MLPITNYNTHTLITFKFSKTKFYFSYYFICSIKVSLLLDTTDSSLYSNFLYLQCKAGECEYVYGQYGIHLRHRCTIGLLSKKKHLKESSNRRTCLLQCLSNWHYITKFVFFQLKVYALFIKVNFILIS